MKGLFIILMLAGSCDLIYAQQYLKVLSPADTNLTFKEQAKKINHYFDTLSVSNTQDDNEEEEIHEEANVQWKRWEWFAMQHLNEQGKIADFGQKNFEIASRLNESVRNSSALLNNGGSWVSLGHNGVFGPMFTAQQGRVNCIAFHPTNPDIIYIGTAGGGIWKSTSGGLLGSWINISDNLPVTSFSGLAIAPNGNTIYALTGDGNNGILSPDNLNIKTHSGVGVLRSDDGGNSWYTTGLNYNLSERANGYKIKIHPGNSDIIFAALTSGLWRSQNGGTTWEELDNSNVTDFELKPNDNNILYYTTAASNQIIKINLTTLTKTPSVSLVTAVNVSRIEIGVTIANPNAVYALVGPGYNTGGAGTPNGTAQYNGLYYSNDQGNSFTKRNDNEDVFALNRDQSNYDIVLNISPSNANEVLIGGVRSYRSTNGGINFSQLNTTNTNLHGDDHALERNPLNGYLFLGDDGGIYRSTDNGLTWSNISLNLVIGEFYRLAGSQGNNELILCGAQDNGHFLRNSNNGLFNSVVSGFDAMDNIIDYSNSNIMYECIQNGGLGKSTNGGTSFIPVAVPDVGQWITPILQSPTLPNTIFYGSNSGILRSTNGGSSWVNIAGYNGAIALAISKLGNRLIASDGSQVKICNNPNAATPVWENEEYPGFYTYPISAIAVNPANADDIMVTFSGYEDRKVARSTDGGINWFNYTLNLPNIPVYSIAFANTNNNPSGATYIGTELGVFYKDDNQPGWEPFFNGLPRVPVTDIFVNYNSNDVTVATFGRGIWRSGGHASCPADLPLTGTIYGNKFFQAAATINSNQVVPATVGNSLKLRAGTTIRLTDGFKANEGSYFNAVNAGCGSGIALRPVSQKKNKPVKKLPIKKKTVTNRNKTEIKK